MRKRTKALIFPIFIVGAIGSSAWAWKTGLVEDVLSTTEIPFHLFYKDVLIIFLLVLMSLEIKQLLNLKSIFQMLKFW